MSNRIVIATEPTPTESPLKTIAAVIRLLAETVTAGQDPMTSRFHGHGFAIDDPLCTQTISIDETAPEVDGRSQNAVATRATVHRFMLTPPS